MQIHLHHGFVKIMCPSPVTVILSLILHRKWQPRSQNLGFKKRAGRGGRPLGWCRRASSGFTHKPAQNPSFRVTSHLPATLSPGVSGTGEHPALLPLPHPQRASWADFQIPSLSEMLWNRLSFGFYAPVVFTFMGLYWFKGLPLVAQW